MQKLARDLSSMSFETEFPSPSDSEEEDLCVFENKAGLAEDLKFLASMPELSDVTFLVGESKEPVCGIRAIMASRSKVFEKMLYQSTGPNVITTKTPKESKFKSFLKRSSETFLNAGNHDSTDNSTPCNPIRIMPHQTVTITEFEPDVFRQLIEYIHTGSVTLQPRTLLGVLNAADRYGLDNLRNACNGFVGSCINVDTVCALLQTADRYVQYKCTKMFLQKVLEYVDERGNEILSLGSFALLPLHVVRLIFSRQGLIAEEFTKFQAALMWTMKYSDMNKDIEWKELFRENFLQSIQFHKIPAPVLMKEIAPLKVVPNHIVVNSLAFQADPSFEPDVQEVTAATVIRSDSQSNISADLASSTTINSLESSGDYPSSPPPGISIKSRFRK